MLRKSTFRVLVELPPELDHGIYVTSIRVHLLLVLLVQWGEVCLPGPRELTLAFFFLHLR